jgi:glutamate dehydrogenase (NAD(P)+)
MCREALKRIGIKSASPRVVVQGSGNVGGIGAKLLQEQGYKIVSLSDQYGAIYNPSGLDVARVLAHIKETGQIVGYPGSQPIGAAEQLTLDCDILIPAAVENQITSANAEQIKARLIVEGANGPTTAAADAILEKRGVVIVPDILANAGGVTVSYFEWVQDRMAYFWSEADVNKRLEDVLVKSFEDVAETSAQYGVSYRIGAYILAIGRVVATYRLRGTYA